MLTLPLSDDFCPGLLVPHRDDARGRGQAVPKIKKIAGQCQLFPFSMIDYHSWEKIMTKLVAFSNKLGVCKYHSYNRGQKPSKRFFLFAEGVFRFPSLQIALTIDSPICQHEYFEVTSKTICLYILCMLNPNNSKLYLIQGVFSHWASP